MFSEKLKALRKALKLTQTAFGERLGVSIDVIKNLEYNRTTPSEIFVNHMCEIYNVNKDWLNGSSDEMFIASYNDDAALVEKMLKQYNPNQSIRTLLYSWSQLPPEKQEMLAEFAEDFAARYRADKK